MKFAIVCKIEEFTTGGVLISKMSQKITRGSKAAS